MSEFKTPRPAILPFLLGDLLLLAVAGGIVYQSEWPLSVAHMALCTAAVALGAWLMVTPFILQYRAELKLAEADALSSTVAQIQNLEQIKTLITEATAGWQNIQGECARTVATAKEVADGMASEAKAFMEFMRQANDSEKATLRLEVDKLRRAEGDWVQVLVRTLDQVYALYLGALHSRQPNLIQQIGNFQNACRDAARRVGLVPYAAEPGEPFNPEIHHPADANETIAAGAPIGQTVATGYHFQGRLIRPAMVVTAAFLAGQAAGRETVPAAAETAAPVAPARPEPEAKGPPAQADLPI